MIEQLQEICLRFTGTMDSFPISHDGCCYIFGHVLSEGLSRAGFKAKRITGHFLIRDELGNLVVYGGNKFKGNIIGDFHCWCVIDYKSEKIIIDASIKYNKKYLKNQGIKPHAKLPDTYIGTDAKSWLIEYIEDKSLDYITQECIDDTKLFFLEHLISIVKEASLELLNPKST